MTTEKGRKVASARKVGKGSVRKPARAAVSSKDKFARVAQVLANADAKTIASLVRDLDSGKRLVKPGIRLTAYEAGSLASQLHASLNPARHRRMKIRYDHIT